MSYLSACYGTPVQTVILTAATIEFSVDEVWLLIENGFYYFGAISLGDIDMIDWFFFSGLIFEIHVQ